jgi:thiopeptide-type bacteriocin biosynthesis protein
MNRVFSLGSEWVYFKIYSGYKIADIILLEYLKEKIELLQSQNHIKKWFFIRYNDSDSHLRIRFQLNSHESFFYIMNELNPLLEDLLVKNYIWKVQNDTYLREIERYGEKTIEDSETLFYFDSILMLDYLSLKNHFQKGDTQLLFSLIAIDRFLDAFLLSISEKFHLLNEMQQSFKNEFNATKVLKSEFDKHYRSLEKEISNTINQFENPEFASLYEIIDEKSNNIKPIVNSIKKNLEINLNSFLSSHIHMMVNRQYTSRQREYEALIYDHLFRYYKTCFYREVDFLKDDTIQNLVTLGNK